MSKAKVVLFVFALLLLAANSGFAASYAVGSCLPKLQSFPTIYQAMNTIPNGSTLMICPGTYYEQVVVNKVVNIKGVVSGGTSRVVIKPAATMYPVTDCISSHTIYPLVMVGTGPVNISNITLDGNASLSADTGFYFYCVAEGTISQVTVRNLYGNAVRMQGSIGYPVVLQKSNLHDITGIGIITEGKVAATIKNNFLSAGSGILWNSTGGSVTGNYITAEGGEQGGTGIGVFSPGTFSGNTIENVGNGLQIGTASGLNFVNNKIYKADIAVNPLIPELNPGANIVKSNTIAGSNTAFEFYCIPETVSGNTISDTSVGMDQLASGVSALNTFANVDAVQTNACP
jgi:hypothetical protein